MNTFSQKWAETLKANKDKFEHGHCGLEFAQRKAVETTTLEELILTHGLPFFVKIDVDGYEANAIRGLKHPVPFLSFEINLPEFRQEGLECVRLLDGQAADGEFNYAADLQRGMALEKWLGAQEFSPKETLRGSGGRLWRGAGNRGPQCFFPLFVLTLSWRYRFITKLDCFARRLRWR